MSSKWADLVFADPGAFKKTYASWSDSNGDTETKFAFPYFLMLLIVSPCVRCKSNEDVTDGSVCFISKSWPSPGSGPWRPWCSGPESDPPAGPAGNEIWPLATWRRPSRKHEFLIVSGSRIFQDSICLDLLIFAWICFRFQLFKNLAPLGLRKVLHSQQSSSGIAATCKEREHTSTAQVWSQA